MIFALMILISRSVAEMDELFEKKIPAWQTAKYITDAQKTLSEVMAQEGLPRGA